MSQVSLDIIRGVAQAAANCYDGALDDEGQPIKVGLKREEGNPMLDSRNMDGFKVKFHGDKLVCTYHSEIKLKDVYKGSLENEVEKTLNDIVSHLKKQYKKITGNALSLSPQGEADLLVQSTSRVRVFVTANKTYKIGGGDGVVSVGEPSREKLEASFKSFLDKGGFESPPKNKHQKGGQGKDSQKDG
jgi:Holliday junction resolvase-like predicted endonuclease